MAETQEGVGKREVHIDFRAETKLQHRKRNKSGRVDLLIDDLGDNQIAVIEIKATNWDTIAPKNVRRNIYRHQKQLFDYADKYFSVDDLRPSIGLIYPFPPEKEGLKEEIEQLALHCYHVPVYWFNELDPEFDPEVLDSV